LASESKKRALRNYLLQKALEVENNGLEPMTFWLPATMIIKKRNDCLNCLAFSIRTIVAFFYYHRGWQPEGHRFKSVILHF
jgi:hypothetical protein